MKEKEKFEEEHYMLIDEVDNDTKDKTIEEQKSEKEKEYMSKKEVKTTSAFKVKKKFKSGRAMLLYIMKHSKKFNNLKKFKRIVNKATPGQGLVMLRIIKNAKATNFYMKERKIFNFIELYLKKKPPGKSMDHKVHNRKGVED